MPTFLHVGCGMLRKDRTTRGFAGPEWNETRLDIDPGVSPDVVGTMTDMSAVAAGSVQAVYSSHNIEHLYPHEVPVALAEFIRVLDDDGFAVITCPDLQSVCALVAQDKLTEPAYVSPSGPIAPIDILYGFRASMANGNLFMAHRCGFTRRVLDGTLRQAGFHTVATLTRSEKYELWAIASKRLRDDAEIRALAAEHLPPH
jgi:predicted SAM-dependent methyltransferase